MTMEIASARVSQLPSGVGGVADSDELRAHEQYNTGQGPKTPLGYPTNDTFVEAKRTRGLPSLMPKAAAETPLSSMTKLGPEKLNQFARDQPEAMAKMLAAVPEGSQSQARKLLCSLDGDTFDAVVAKADGAQKAAIQGLFASKGDIRDELFVEHNNAQYVPYARRAGTQDGIAEQGKLRELADGMKTIATAINNSQGEVEVDGKQVKLDGEDGPRAALEATINKGVDPKDPRYVRVELNDKLSTSGQWEPATETSGQTIRLPKREWASKDGFWKDPAKVADACNTVAHELRHRDQYDDKAKKATEAYQSLFPDDRDGRKQVIGKLLTDPEKLVKDKLGDRASPEVLELARDNVAMYKLMSSSSDYEKKRTAPEPNLRDLHSALTKYREAYTAYREGRSEKEAHLVGETAQRIYLGQPY